MSGIDGVSGCGATASMSLLRQISRQSVTTVARVQSEC